MSQQLDNPNLRSAPPEQPLTEHALSQGLNDSSGKVSFTVVACRNDIHYAKAAVASVRHFYPQHVIHLICDDDVPTRDLKQLASVPLLRVHPVKEVTKETKLHLRGLLATISVVPMGSIRRTVYLDADAVLVGPILNKLDVSKPFISFLASWKDLSDPKQKAWYDEWAFDTDKIRKIDPDFPSLERACWIGGSNFYIDTDRFPKADLFRLLPHLNERRADRDIFREDQGFWSYIATRRFIEEPWFEPLNCVVDCNSSSANKCELTVDNVLARETNGVYFLHYLGGARRYWPSQHYFGGVLDYFYRMYYEKYAPGARGMDEALRGKRFLQRAARYALKKAVRRR